MQRKLVLLVTIVTLSFIVLLQVIDRFPTTMPGTLSLEEMSQQRKMVKYSPEPINTDFAHAPDVRRTDLAGTGAANAKAIDSARSALGQTNEIAEYTDREELYAARREVVRRGCLSQKKTPPTVNNFSHPGRYLIEPRHNILYCPIPKVSSSFWKKILTVMAQRSDRNVHDMTLAMVELSSIQKLTSKQLTSLKKFGTSFFFIREPYARLFSGYENKLYHPTKAFWAMIGSSAVKVARNTTDVRYKRFGFDVTFPEFVKYILHKFEHGQDIEAHFKPMHKTCDPCEMQYQYIGKLETLKEDYDFLLTKWRKQYPDVNVTISHFDRDAAIGTAKGHVRFLFETKAILKEIQFPFSKLMLRTWRDLQIRGYVSKYLEFPFKNYKNVETITKEDMIKALEVGIDSTDDKIAAKSQRDEALIQAYRGVAMEDMERLSKYVATDCQLFGYDQRPDKLFDRSKPIDTHFVYLDGLK